MKKLKALTAIMLGGLALASCVDNSNSNGGGSKTASFNIMGGFDVLSMAGAPANGGTVGSSNITVNVTGSTMKFTCPANYVTLTAIPSSGQLISKTCNNPLSAGGCDYELAGVTYDSVSSDGWLGGPGTADAGDPGAMANNLADDGGHSIVIACVPSNQLALWS
ncbi:hypothetical protein QIW57_02825 [Francisellaceae bacterium CB52]|jgi:hypothetical protein